MNNRMIRQLFFSDSPGLSAFKLERLQQTLQNAGITAGLRAVNRIYLLRLTSELDGPSKARLESLLGPLNTAPLNTAGSSDTQNIFVVPRLGTLSPWSSKATDIAHIAGLQQIERLETGLIFQFDSAIAAESIAPFVHDRMTETVLTEADKALQVFDEAPSRPLRRVPLLEQGISALERANTEWGLALSCEEIAYLAKHYQEAQRDPSDAELMMFGQINSEHCRHKIFNASWTIDGEEMSKTLFGMIRETHQAAPDGVLSAYVDNAAVAEGSDSSRFHPDRNHQWQASAESVPYLMKVETHNHPTAISPDPGAATGAGGEIRDEAATGRGGRPKAGLCGFSVSHLRIPGHEQPWEGPESRPDRIASPISIMTEGPLGAAAYNNEFGRPNLAGYFRCFEQRLPNADNERYGYHKPIMIAGGIGNVRSDHVQKQAVPVDALLVVLGGPAMLIGLGGGAASSMQSGASSEDLDFASVQRANPELERRCQEVIDRCWEMGDGNPIISIHDIGAGGLSNGLPELVDADDRGGQFQLRDIQSADPSLSPMEIWCNESQERYVLAIAPENRELFGQFCERERAPWAVVGTATAERQLQLIDSQSAEKPVDMPMQVLLGNTPPMQRDVIRAESPSRDFSLDQIELADAINRVLQFPTVASKSFLITIGDRSVGGVVARDQMVGPWQTPVADCAVTLAGFSGHSGEAMAMGERPPVALLSGPASARLAVSEALLNILSADVASPADVRFSANWMAACGVPGQDACLYDTVEAISQTCQALGIAIPVGKDSLSMRTQWQENATDKSVHSPVSLVVTGFSKVGDVRKTLTPELRGQGELVLVSLNPSAQRLGASALAQVYDGLTANGSSEDSADLQDAASLTAVFQLVNQWRDRLTAYHDVSDGGLLVTLLEMAFASRCGLNIALPNEQAAIDFLFNEEPAIVVQVDDVDGFILSAKSLQLTATVVASRSSPESADADIVIRQANAELFRGQTHALLQTWSNTSFAVSEQRDDPSCAAEEQASLGDINDPGMSCIIPEAAAARIVPAPAVVGTAPKVAVLREQGVNSQVEMAWAFSRAGFQAVDVHMNDLRNGSATLEDFQVAVAPGGFSFGDVLGAGRGWAAGILSHSQLRDQFEAFFNRQNTLALGVCNGCQMMSELRALIPGTDHWPSFQANRSGRFEGRTSLVEILPSRSVFLDGLSGMQLPIAVAHGEGRVVYGNNTDQASLAAGQQLSMRYVSNTGSAASSYPANPNGSPDGLTGFCNNDGRITIMMPHPERVVRNDCLSWKPESFSERWGEDSPWLAMFSNAKLASS